ncbi:hypothetical protein [Subtercola sp. RTI3]|uniref:hypothetical protein n=1 Tax=Subtercola sp. RTI3 TaxID=3048639 RepID=UPI002B239BFE|nr:hypothetical protein [Subtercola sp. RTI3]
MAETYIACDQMAALCADGEAVELWVFEPYSTRSLTVSLANAPGIPDQLFVPYFTFAFDVVAPDPLKYSARMLLSTGLPVPGGGLRWPLRWPLRFGLGNSSGRVKVLNVGTADSRNIMTVTGGGSTDGFQLIAVGTGQTLTLERAVPDGSTVTFNSRTGRVYLDGSDITRFLTDDDWFVAPAGGSLTVQFLALGEVTGIPILTIEHQAAYW